MVRLDKEDTGGGGDSGIRSSRSGGVSSLKHECLEKKSNFHARIYSFDSRREVKPLPPLIITRPRRLCTFSPALPIPVLNHAVLTPPLHQKTAQFWISRSAVSSYIPESRGALGTGRCAGPR
ncbi:hypothetical protein E2C01_075873 [Portunus trituberculatus]|uniref:Uncharacterized protein n=1 Tax=Portunus trituberculatus TaxID=210409 RepID=A0A5B7IGX1_PORTR|nr:hypothetical protein [Portunus trituberculatus]